MRDDHLTNAASPVIVEESTFVARFLRGVGVAAESVANVDAFVDLADGSGWAPRAWLPTVRRRLGRAGRQRVRELAGLFRAAAAAREAIILKIVA
jgi:hypothetical protein